MKPAMSVLRRRQPIVPERTWGDTRTSPLGNLGRRHLHVTLPFVAHCNCIGYLYNTRPGYRPHLPLST